MSSATQPVKIRRRDPSRVEIDWADGHTTVYSAALLRRMCPCALCIHELTGQPLLDPTTVPDDLTQSSLEMVGNYAISARFSDGHHTGIYSYPFLRENDPEG